ncbi:LacI family DNA-binding transcriptional regulator [Streptacidiphilus jeojiense]|uniref:LacI family DNA-binding transcriptional regulator n=1 Tax=Streptacidiphilus jeojiense TaxID=436229 RepID=UPI00068C10A6|nr:LacI family DNA-binding transcriptional regulator [Streptacidiphilus jeojiense]
MTRRLAEVAKRVGVSEATVSRVLNGKPGVSDTTRQSVLTALDVLGYERPTQLRGVRARLVGLVLTEAEYVTMLLDQQVSGVVFCGGLSADEYRQLLGRGVPVVLLNAAVDYSGVQQREPAYGPAPARLGFPQVSTDDTSAVEQAFAHLTSLGHRRIGLLVGPEDHTPSLRKIAAFRSLTARAGGREDHRIGSAFMNYTDPPLTTLRQPIEAMAKAAVTLLVNQIQGGAPTPKELLHEPELVVRGSTGPRTDPVREAEELTRQVGV